MNYLELLNHSYEQEPDMSRLQFLSQYIFNFTTYDGEMDKLFAQKAVEVCTVINEKTTFKYIEDEENYQWYLIMCNMPFLQNKIEWGTSIRGAWWIYDDIEIESCGLYENFQQIQEPLVFNNEQWPLFVKALSDFIWCETYLVNAGKITIRQNLNKEREKPMNEKLTEIYDPTLELIDELAHLCEYWSKHRAKNHTPHSIKRAIILIAHDIAIIDQVDNNALNQIPNETPLSKWVNKGFKSNE